MFNFEQFTVAKCFTSLNSPIVSSETMPSFHMKQLDCFLSGDDKCFAFLFHLWRLIFSVTHRATAIWLISMSHVTDGLTDWLTKCNTSIPIFTKIVNWEQLMMEGVRRNREKKFGGPSPGKGQKSAPLKKRASFWYPFFSEHGYNEPNVTRWST